MATGNDRIALLIDADNASATKIEAILESLQRHGSVEVRRAYGAESHLKPWKAALHAHDIEKVQQLADGKGKNATDIAMVIGAMDLLYAGSTDAFALVSSDADFAPLASRLRSGGMKVYGFGDAKAPKPFRVACTKFTIVRGRVKRSKVKAMGNALTSPSKLVTPAGNKQKLCADPAFRLALRTAVVSTKATSGWANLGRVRTEISQHPFELRGYGKFSTLMEATGLFEIRRVGLVAQVRVKPQT